MSRETDRELAISDEERRGSIFGVDAAVGRGICMASAPRRAERA